MPLICTCSFPSFACACEHHLLHLQGRLLKTEAWMCHEPSSVSYCCHMYMEDGEPPPFLQESEGFITFVTLFCLPPAHWMHTEAWLHTLPTELRGTKTHTSTSRAVFLNNNIPLEKKKPFATDCNKCKLKTENNKPV